MKMSVGITPEISHVCHLWDAYHHLGSKQILGLLSEDCILPWLVFGCATQLVGF